MPLTYYARPCAPTNQILCLNAEIGNILCTICTTPDACRTPIALGDAPMPPTNPKELHAVADGKAPLEYLEAVCNPGEARVLKGGADKYGRRNFTVSPIRASVYVGALRRHTDAWAAGEDIDPDSGESPLSHIRACIAVLQAAMAAGTFVDDRGEAAVSAPEPPASWSIAVEGVFPATANELRRRGLRHKEMDSLRRQGLLGPIIGTDPCNVEGCTALPSCVAAGSCRKFADTDYPASRKPALPHDCTCCGVSAGATVCGRTRYTGQAAMCGIPLSPCPLTGLTEWVGD